ncbi:integrase_H2C2 domain-containing protein [Trichonephila inaurata madagascariensis]|uniref:Integrase_H2C2 domain-containing protein n=1 Tax=Trichonephila inaurata madagascariensis TaxID=2747483 RepID=A0A8X6J706_9ARAC|nr:integrase_H2C2 domain-containing protein [Trichonephila inaurata madagascariensis]GFY58624.1 integrase_H2C2 domain-containing protein [Trichonephila inaurata madagascariensis]
MVAWMLRVLNNAKKTSRIISELKSKEIQSVKLSVIIIVHREKLSELKEKYASSIQFSKEFGIVKVKTKLILGEDSDDFQGPVVPPDHPIMRLYIEHAHKTMMQSGVQTTLNWIREHYWVPRGRRIVREVVSKCVVCKIHSSKPVQPDTTPLPLDTLAAFQVTGVDLAGALYLRQGYGIERVAKLQVGNGFIRLLQRLYPLEMSVSDLPSDIALGENFPEPNKDSDRLKSPEVPSSNPPAPNPVPEISRPVKQTRCGRRIVPRQRLNL